MATVDLTVGGTTKVQSANSGRMCKLEKTLNFATTSRDSGDILQLFDIPAGSFVSHIVLNVTTAEGDASTVDIGLTGVDADGFFDGADVNAVAQTCSAPGALAEATPNTFSPTYSQGKFFASTDTIDMLLNDDLDAAVMTVSVFLTQP